MSLVLCDVTPNQIIFLADSAHPTEGKKPEDCPNDATKVLLTPNRRIGLGIAGVLNFRWNNNFLQPEKWIDDFLQRAAPDDVSSPAKLAQALKRSIELLRNIPYNGDGRIMIAGFTNALPEFHEIQLQSKSRTDTDLVATVSQPDQFPRVLGITCSWEELVSRSGQKGKPIPEQATERFRHLKNIMERSVVDFRSNGELQVASPINGFCINKTP